MIIILPRDHLLQHLIKQTMVPMVGINTTRNTTVLAILPFKKETKKRIIRKKDNSQNENKKKGTQRIVSDPQKEIFSLFSHILVQKSSAILINRSFTPIHNLYTYFFFLIFLIHNKYPIPKKKKKKRYSCIYLTVKYIKRCIII
jgi:hypothetical protein